ncbi:hypothetical protein ACOME3_009771 [Neoechinorhynchus agilis]
MNIKTDYGTQNEKESKESCTNTIGTSHRCTVKSLDDFVSRTNFTKKEVQFLYRKFKQDFPGGAASEQDFLNVYRKMFPHSDTCKYSRYIFSALNRSQTQFVTFEDFIQSLDILSNGTNEDKLGWIFDLYDIKHSNRLTSQDVEDLLSAICDLSGKAITESQQSDAIRMQAETFFNMLNGADKGYVDRNDFVRTFCENEQVIIALQNQVVM